MLHNNNNHKKALRHGRLCFILVLLFLGVKGVFCRIICSINIFDSFFLAGVFIHIEMVHLHFDNVRICTKHTCEKYIKLQMNANYIFSHQKVPNVAFAYRHCTHHHRVLLIKKRKNLNEVYRCRCVRNANISFIKFIRRFIHSFEHTYEAFENE